MHTLRKVASKRAPRTPTAIHKLTSIPCKIALTTLGFSIAVYVGLLAALIIAPSLQAYVIYLHKVTLTWGKDLNIPEQFGMLQNQAVPFHLRTEDGVRLHAWHVMPFGAYQANREAVIHQDLTGPVEDITKTVNFRLLRDDPGARLVLYMHGTSGTLGSTIRPTSYRNIYSADTDKIHVLTFDYRGYGLSDGFPSEPGLLLDALAVVHWATNVAQISPDRIVIYGQSLGSAVTVSLINHLASQTPVFQFAGVVISAAFSDIASLSATYRLGGVVPVLSPVARIPPLFRFFTSKLQDTWLVKDKIAEFVRMSHGYHITLIHSEDDSNIPYGHTHDIFWHAVNATDSAPISREELAKEGMRRKVDQGAGGWHLDWNTKKGSIRLQILKYGKHDWQMTYPVTADAILRAFRSKKSDFAREMMAK